MIKPTKNRVTQTAAEHGYAATDYSFQPDEWVYAPETGTITDVTLNAGNCGKRIILQSGNHQYYMCHFQDVAVRAGEPVKEGHRLGIMGDTGKSFGRHLHLVIYDGGQRVADPDKWLNERIPKVSRPTKEEVRLAYKLDGRTASASAQNLHSTKGTVKSLLQGLINDSAKAGDRKTIANQKAKIAQLEKELKNCGGSFTEVDRESLNFIKSTVAWIKNKIEGIFK